MLTKNYRQLIELQMQLRLFKDKTDGKTADRPDRAIVENSVEIGDISGIRKKQPLFHAASGTERKIECRMMRFQTKRFQSILLCKLKIAGH